MSSAPSAQFLARRAEGAAAAASPSPPRPTRSSLLRMSAMENGVRFLSSVIRAEQERIYVQYNDVVILQWFAILLSYLCALSVVKVSQFRYYINARVTNAARPSKINHVESNGLWLVRLNLFSCTISVQSLAIVVLIYSLRRKFVFAGIRLILCARLQRHAECGRPRVRQLCRANGVRWTDDCPTQYRVVHMRACISYLDVTRECAGKGSVCRGGVEKGTGRPATGQWRTRSRDARSRRPSTAKPPAQSFDLRCVCV